MNLKQKTQELQQDPAKLRMFIKRILMSLTGVALCGVIVGVFNVISLGADPFTVFVVGIGNIFNLSYGQMYPIVTGTLLLLVFIIDRHYINIATLFNLTMIGVIADITSKAMLTYCPPSNMVERLLWLAANIIVLCLASSLYMVADLGVSAYDAMAIIISKKTPIPFRFCRIGTDFICVGVGFCFGAVIGIGTLVTAFFMGPVIQLFNNVISIPFLYGKDHVQPVAAKKNT